MEQQQEAKLHFLDYWRVIRVRLGLVLLVFVLVVITTGVATYFAPRKYTSFATIEVQPDITPVRIFDQAGGQQQVPSDSRFAQTQFQIIERKSVLYPVIDRLDLANRWSEKGEHLSKEKVYALLLSMISLEEVRNTNLIEINVLSTDPNEAATIANTIAEVYMERRIAESQSTVTLGLDQLRSEVDKQEKAVSDAYAEASRLRTESNINDPNPDNLEGGSRVEDSSVTSNQEKVNEAQSQLATLRSKVEALDKLKSDDLMRAASQLNLGDPIIEKNLPIYQTAQAERARMLSSGLGPNHPDVRAAQAQIDTIELQLRQQIDSIRKGYATQLAILENSLKAMQVNLTTSQEQQQQVKTASSRYIDAKYKYVQARKLLEAAKARFSSVSMEQTMPQRPAFIRDSAEPALKPSQPNVKLNLILGAGGGLILSLVMAFFLEYLDTSVKTMEDVERFLDVPVLAIIPKKIKLLTHAGEDTADAEAYRILKTNTDLHRKKIHAQTVSMLSGGAGEGKSTTVCNLATTWAASGQRILVVDADMRRPSQHRLFEADNRVGLGNYLKGRASLTDVIQATSVENLQLIPAGTLGADAVSLLNSERMEDLLEETKARFDLILFDCPPILGVSDTSIIATLTDCCLIVVQHRRFPRSMLLRVKKTIEGIGGHVLGVVLNNVDIRHDQNYAYYTSYSHYYAHPEKNKRRSPKAELKSAARSKEDEY
jgi:polysaccharide biosynthesis transport protein